MNMVHDPALANIDLNLFLAFDVLAQTLNVTRAAERLGVTQSAMSHTLRRLRDVTADPLLVRSGNGMVLTPRAEQLLVPVRSALLILQRGLADPREFRARESTRTFCVATPDLFDALAIPPLLERVREEAPSVDVQITPVQTPQLVQKLETGDVDVAVMPRADTLPAQDSPAGLMRRTLFRDNYACFIRADHPALSRRARSRLRLQQYVKLSHALITPSGRGPGVMDVALAERGLRRRVALRLPTFHSALSIVAQTDLVLTAPAALAALCGAELGLLVLPTPVPLPDHSIDLVWHSRFDADPAGAWLRERLREVSTHVQRRIQGVGRA
ncbi:MAG: LysR family transcriptional regulator [Polyangiaceae bacterium]